MKENHHALLTSVHNPRIKQWAELLERKGRDRHGKFLAEGVHMAVEALKSGRVVEAVLYSQDKGVPAELEPFAASASTGGEGPEWIAVSARVLEKLADTRTPQGVIAVVRKTEASAAPFLADPRALVVAIDGVQDPGNLGTIIRSADAVGATGVVLGRGTVDLYNPKTLRATMGSLFHVPVVRADLPALLARAEAGDARGLQLVGTSLQAEESCYALDFTRPTWLVFGSEGAGVSPQTEARLTRRVRIPMPGRAESLNVAMAATVLLFEAARQRTTAGA
jgi:TrmH family RNA methyltransferase